MEGRPKELVPSTVGGKDNKHMDPAASGPFSFHFREQHLEFFERMMLSGLCLFQIPFSLIISEATSSKKTSMISS